MIVVNLPDPIIPSDPYLPTEPSTGNIFEKQYIACRRKEKRMYTDDEVKQLPACAPAHPHHAEWLIRGKSFKKLRKYLADKKRPLSILEIGCGNGWLSHRLSLIPQTNITGVDINFTEIEQAARVFNHCDNLIFVYGDIQAGILQHKRFDIILFAASIQYFQFTEILFSSFQHLQPSGEIHLIDSRFYTSQTVSAARARSAAYFNEMGFPEMAGHYFHHTIDELNRFDHTILYDPSSIFNRMTPNPIPFHWIRIKNNIL
jgi:ubiquinone/menaquinone biosynthesis C-methylase UbiE